MYQLGKIKNKKSALKALGVDSGGISIMANKMELIFLYIKDIKAPAANILKQDALSIGADLAVPNGVIMCEKEFYDAILIGTKKHMKLLSKKELAQPFGLKKIAKDIDNILNIKNYSSKLMGIVNANDDSFFEDSRFFREEAIEKIEQLINDGAQIIDIGAVSSRPNSKVVSEDIELDRIKYICDTIKSQKLFDKVDFSIDSYSPNVIEYALNSGFKIVNDITGAENIDIIKLVTKYNAKIVIMHMQGTPQTMQDNPNYNDVMEDISLFFQKQIDRCNTLGVLKDNIILDVGIGFGKSLEHNITLIKNLRHFSSFGCEVLIGSSRKSMIDEIDSSSVNDRLPGTLAIHLKALENGASIIRCHDVKEHKQAMRVHERLQ